jgi:hypothetical protein
VGLCPRWSAETVNGQVRENDATFNAVNSVIDSTVHESFDDDRQAKFRVIGLKPLLGKMSEVSFCDVAVSDVDGKCSLYFHTNAFILEGWDSNHPVRQFNSWSM